MDLSNVDGYSAGLASLSVGSSAAGAPAGNTRGLVVYPSGLGLGDVTNALGSVSLLPGGSTSAAGVSSVGGTGLGITLTPSGTVGLNLGSAAAAVGQHQVTTSATGSSMLASLPNVRSNNNADVMTTNPPSVGIDSVSLQAQQCPVTALGSPVIDMLDIPGKGRCYVYIARYDSTDVCFCNNAFA